MRTRRNRRAAKRKDSSSVGRSGDVIFISSDEDGDLPSFESSNPPKRQKKPNRTRSSRSLGGKKQPVFVWISDSEKSPSRSSASVDAQICDTVTKKSVSCTLSSAVSVADSNNELCLEQVTAAQETRISDSRKSYVPACLQDPEYNSYYGKYSVFFTEEDSDSADDDILEYLARVDKTNNTAGTSNECLEEAEAVKDQTAEVISDDVSVTGELSNKTINIDDDQQTNNTNSSTDDLPTKANNHIEKTHLLNVWFRVKNVKFEIKTFEPIKNLMDYLVEKENADYDAMIPLYKDEKIGPLDTPYHLDFGKEETIDFIYGLKQNHFEFYKYKIGKDEIILKVQSCNKKDGVENIRINKYHTLGVLYRLYAERKRLSWTSFKLIFDGDIINFNDTAEDLGMSSDDIVDYRWTEMA